MAMKFLLVDDHQIIRDGLKKILLANYPTASIEECGDAEEVIDKIGQSVFDLVICDLSMPGRSGIDVVKQLKESLPKLPVLILSMHPEEHYAIRAIKAGAAGYINKTMGGDELLKAVQRILQGRKYISAELAELLTDDLVSSQDHMHAKLSDREFEVFKLIAAGRPLTEIAGQLSLSLSTVSTHRSRILDKLKMTSNAELIKYAIQQGLA
jgi:two-component system, NarL family, invasion response regulator UvrY